MPIPKPRFIYFDLDDTLLDHRHAERMSLADVHRVFAEEMQDISLETVREVYHQHNMALWKQYAQGQIDKHQLRVIRFRRLLDGVGLSHLDPLEMAQVYLDAYYRHWIFCEGAQQAYHALADIYPTGIITNGFSEIQHAKMAQIDDVKQRIKTLIISEEFGVMKPDPRLFAHAAKSAGFPPEDLLYIGDSYSSDVQGGLKAGWSVAWYQRNAPFKNEEGVFSFQDWQSLVDHLVTGD